MLCADCINLFITPENKNHKYEAKPSDLIQGICISCGKRIAWDERLCTDCKKPIVANITTKKQSVKGRCRQIFKSIKKNDYKA